MLEPTAKQAGGAGDAAPRPGHRLNAHFTGDCPSLLLLYICPSLQRPHFPSRKTQRGRNHPQTRLAATKPAPQ